MGGGLLRSVGGWEAVRELRRGREGYASHERILGGTEFVERVLREVERETAQRAQATRREIDVPTLIRRVCQPGGVTPEGLVGGGRLRALSRVREGVAFLWIEHLGRSGRQLAHPLGITPESVYKAAQRGRREQGRWRRLLGI